MERRIFVTGGTGFFGKSMLDYRLRHPEWEWAHAKWVVLSRSPDRFKRECPILAEQEGVSFISGDVRNFVLTDGGRFDAIIHAATSVDAMSSDEDTMDVIVGGTERVIHFARSIDCRKILFASSGAVYGHRYSPASEDDECVPATAYGKGKLAAERMLIESGLDVKIARCFAFVGPYLPLKGHYAIGNFIQDCLDGGSIVINGDGTPLRSYLYADDLVEWLFAILDMGRCNRVYNVGSASGISIADLAVKVTEALAASNRIVVKGRSLCAGPEVYVPVVDRIVRELGVQERFTLEDAIRNSVSKA